WHRFASYARRSCTSPLLPLLVWRRLECLVDGRDEPPHQFLDGRVPRRVGAGAFGLQCPHPRVQLVTHRVSLRWCRSYLVRACLAVTPTRSAASPTGTPWERSHR